MNERMMDKTVQPSDDDMVNWIGYPISADWISLKHFLEDQYNILPIFDSGGKRYGWNLQFRLGKRPLAEMYPEHGSFTALVILGKAELAQAMERLNNYGANVQQVLQESPRYHDGCWMYIRVGDPFTSKQDVQDIEELVLIKRKPVKGPQY